jgi:hypothetical protein
MSLVRMARLTPTSIKDSDCWSPSSCPVSRGVVRQSRSVPTGSVSGTYAGDEPGVSATLALKPDHTFERVIHTVSVTKQVTGSWSVGQNGDIVFSKDFLKASGEPLRSDETAASAWDPKGPNLQIEIAMTSRAALNAQLYRLYWSLEACDVQRALARRGADGNRSQARLRPGWRDRTSRLHRTNSRWRPRNECDTSRILHEWMFFHRPPNTLRSHPAWNDGDHATATRGAKLCKS